MDKSWTTYLKNQLPKGKDIYRKERTYTEKYFLNELILKKKQTWANH